MIAAGCIVVALNDALLESPLTFVTGSRNMFKGWQWSLNCYKDAQVSLRAALHFPLIMPNKDVPSVRSYFSSWFQQDFICIIASNAHSGKLNIFVDQINQWEIAVTGSDGSVLSVLHFPSCRIDRILIQCTLTSRPVSLDTMQHVMARSTDLKWLLRVSNIDIWTSYRQYWRCLQIIYNRFNEVHVVLLEQMICEESAERPAKLQTCFTNGLSLVCCDLAQLGSGLVPETPFPFSVFAISYHVQRDKMSFQLV